MKYRHKVLGFLFFLSIITYLDRVCISLLGKSMKADLGLNNEQFGWVLGAFSLAYALFEIPTGAMGDRIGPRRVLTRIVVWWSAFTAATGAAFHWLYLVVVRFLFGIGEAGAYPNASIVISRWFPANETGRAQSFIWAAGRLGGAIAPPLVLGITAWAGWRVAFGVIAIIGVIWAVIWYRWFRDFPHETPEISPDERQYIEENRRFKPHPHGIEWKTMLRDPNILALIFMFHFYMYAAYFYYSWMPIYLQEGRGMNEKQMMSSAMMPFILGALGCFIGGFVSDWLSKRYGLKTGRRTVGVVGMGLASLVIFLAASATDNSQVGMYLAMGMLFKDLTLPVSFAVCVDIGKSKSGTVTGTMNMWGQMGGFFLSIIFGKIVDSTHDYNIPLYLVSGLLVISSLLWFVIDPTKEVKLKG
ncbi:MAG: MFS transporter [Spirosomataceae bacterium]